MAHYNGRNCASYYWEWIDDTGVRYVGSGSSDATGTMPWDALWQQRGTIKGTLGEWLRSLSEPPRRAGPTFAMPGLLAKGLATRRRRELRAAGVRLLHHREFRRGPRQPVAGFPSIRAAVKGLGITRRELVRLCGL